MLSTTEVLRSIDLHPSPQPRYSLPLSRCPAMNGYQCDQGSPIPVAPNSSFPVSPDVQHHDRAYIRDSPKSNRHDCTDSEESVPESDDDADTQSSSLSSIPSREHRRGRGVYQLDTTPRPPVSEIIVSTSQEYFPQKRQRLHDNDSWERDEKQLAYDWQSSYFVSQKNLYDTQRVLEQLYEENRKLKRTVVEFQRQVLTMRRNRCCTNQDSQESSNPTFPSGGWGSRSKCAASPHVSRRPVSGGSFSESNDNVVLSPPWTVPGDVKVLGRRTLSPSMVPTIVSVESGDSTHKGG
jgi:hypothetical protein